MSPEEYALSRERILYLSEHPLADRDTADDTATDDRPRTRQATLSEVAR